MGMARLAEAMVDTGEERVVPLFDLKPSRIGEALRLALVQAENDTSRSTDRGKEISEAIEQIRDAAALQQSRERRIRELEAALEATQEDARRDLRSAKDRAEQAEARASAQAERAASAERRLQSAEDRLDQVMTVIESELMPRTERA